MTENAEIREYRLKPDLQLVDATLSAMKKYFQAHGLPPNAWSELELAAAEALNNAIEQEDQPAGQPLTYDDVINREGCHDLLGSSLLGRPLSHVSSLAILHRNLLSTLASKM